MNEVLAADVSGLVKDGRRGVSVVYDVSGRVEAEVEGTWSK